MRTTSNRELARQIGVSETAVRRAEKSGRIRREADGSFVRRGGWRAPETHNLEALFTLFRLEPWPTEKVVGIVCSR